MATQKKSRPGERPTKLTKQQRRAARVAAAKRRQRIRVAARAAIGLTLVGAVAAIVVLSSGSGGSSGSTDPMAWDLPAMGPTADQQERVSLASLAGRPTIANFFASWCTACDDELPGFARVSAELDDQIQFVGIASQETGDAMLMPRRHGVDWWPLARDIGGHTGDGLSRALGARGMPLTAFYDAEGALLHVQLGALTEPQLRSAITQLYGIDA